MILSAEGPLPIGTEHEAGFRLGLEGANIDTSIVIYGIDPMQAMLLAIRHLHGFVTKVFRSIHPRRLVRELGDGEEDLGLIVDSG